MRIYWMIAAFFLLSACSSQSYSKNIERNGQASWYGSHHQGKKTANGERFNQHELTAAHRTLPFGTKVKVTNARTNKSVIVRINDRGPYAKGRIIDLSRAAAQQLNIVNSGVAPVHIQVIR